MTHPVAATSRPRNRETRTTRMFAVIALALAAQAQALHAQKEGATSKGAIAPDQTRMWAAQTSTTEIRLNWVHAPGAVSYTIICSVNAQPPRVVGSVGAPGAIVAAVVNSIRRMSYTLAIRGLGVHRCSVRAVNAKGLASADVPFNPVTPIAKSALTRVAPATVTATETGSGEITVTWTEVPGATAYFIGRAVAPNGFMTICDLCPTTTTYVDSAVTAGARHIYTVGAITPQGAFPRTTSNVVIAGAGSGGQVAAADTSGGSKSAVSGLKGPSGVTATLTGPSSARVTWTPVQNAIAFEVSRIVNGVARVVATVAPIASLIPGVGQVIQWLDQDLLVGLTGGTLTSSQKLSVEYSVKAIYAGTDSAKALSPAVSSNTLLVDSKAAAGTTGGTTTTVAYAAPSSAVAMATSATSVRLTWRPATGVAQCDIQRSSNGGAYGTLATLPASTSSYLDAATNVPTLRPRYRITCGDPKGLVNPAVAFTIPVWDPKGSAP